MANKGETLHWADQIARDIKNRAESNKILKKVVKKHGYIILDEKTPSGNIHIGSGRGWIIHDVIAKALRDLGLKAKFILSSDDIDPYDKPLKGLPKSFDQYLGMPFRNIPSPVKGYKSMADYYFMQCVEKFEEFGIEAEIQSTGESYEAGEFNETIKIALDNHEKIKKIFEDMYGKPYDRLPFNPICEKCGRIGTTKATKWDKEKELVYYKCEPDLVEWAAGCSHEGWISPYNGNGKFPWKVEWAAKWPTKNVVYEVAGKDHFTKLGSRDIAIRISYKVFNFPPPLPSIVTEKEGHTIYDTGKGYEFFNVGGKKMSTSKGEGMSFAEVSKYLPPYLVRYLLVRSRLHTSIDFDPYGRNDLILLFERYDKTERVYFKKEKTDEKEHHNQTRIYELSHIGKIPNSCPIQVSLVHAATVAQATLDDQGAIKTLQRTGHLPANISGEDMHYVLERLHYARGWLKTFADDDYKFSVQDKVGRIQMSNKQKQAISELINTLKKGVYSDISDIDLHNEFYRICGLVGIDVKEFFKVCYLIIINKERGPKLAAFINTLGYDKVITLLEQAKNA